MAVAPPSGVNAWCDTPEAIMTTVPAVGDLVMQIQGDFLERPQLRLTPSQAEARFGLERRACSAILEALAEANVLEKTNDGAYARFFPRAIGRRPAPGHSFEHAA
jgi:hypothetical protein